MSLPPIRDTCYQGYPSSAGEEFGSKKSDLFRAGPINHRHRAHAEPSSGPFRLCRGLGLATPSPPPNDSASFKSPKTKVLGGKKWQRDGNGPGPKGRCWRRCCSSILCDSCPGSLNMPLSWGCGYSGIKTIHSYCLGRGQGPLPIRTLLLQQSLQTPGWKLS